MMSALSIFLMVGLAHWAAHLLQGESCKRTVWSNTTFLLVGAVQLFGWPIHACGYAVDLLTKKAPSSLTIAEAVKIGEETATKFVKQKMAEMNGGVGVLEIRQEPNESLEAFHTRIAKTVAEHTAQIRAEREAQKGAQDENANASRP
jgi:hypothetical protein